VHGRWEGELFERYRAKLKIAPAPPEAVTNPRDFMFDVLLASNKLSDGVLEADRRAALGRDFYDDGYFDVFAKDQLPVVERRLNEAITAVASLIVGAWQQAGKPAVPVERQSTPRPVSKPRG
jgi:hypothetical protein